MWVLLPGDILRFWGHLGKNITLEIILLALFPKGWLASVFKVQFYFPTFWRDIDIFQWFLFSCLSAFIPVAQPFSLLEHCYILIEKKQVVVWRSTSHNLSGPSCLECSKSLSTTSEQFPHIYKFTLSDKVLSLDIIVRKLDMLSNNVELSCITVCFMSLELAFPLSAFLG